MEGPNISLSTYYFFYIYISSHHVLDSWTMTVTVGFRVKVNAIAEVSVLARVKSMR